MEVLNWSKGLLAWNWPYCWCYWAFRRSCRCYWSRSSGATGYEGPGATGATGPTLSIKFEYDRYATNGDVYLPDNTQRGETVVCILDLQETLQEDVSTTRYFRKGTGVGQMVQYMISLFLGLQRNVSLRP